MKDNENPRRNDLKEHVRRRLRASTAPTNYEFYPDNRYEGGHKRVAIYTRVPIDDARQITSFEIQKQRFENFVARHPNWTLVGYYIDRGSPESKMKITPKWSTLLEECFDGKVDLIVTQKVSNISRDPFKVVQCACLLAAQSPPIGIYFISENLFTLTSNCMEVLKDMGIFSSDD